MRGTEFLADEEFKLAFDKGRGIVSGPDDVRSGLILTNRRLIHTSGILMTRRTGSALLSDVRYIEVVQRGRSVKALAIAISLLVVGSTLAWLSSFDFVGAGIGKLTASSGLDSGAGDVQGILDGTLGGFTGMLTQSLRLGAVASLLLAPLVFLYYLSSGEFQLGVNLGGERVALSIAKAKSQTAQVFINAFFACKASASE